MAAEIKPLPTSPLPKLVTVERPVLISKIEGGGEDVNCAVIICSGAAVLSIADDKYVSLNSESQSTD